MASTIITTIYQDRVETRWSDLGHLGHLGQLGHILSGSVGLTWFINIQV